MNEKDNLAKLYANINLPMNEYVQLPAFIEIENDIDTIENIEPFFLPEITKLICGSSKYANISWAQKYRYVKELYCFPEKIDVLHVFNDSKDVKEFESKILVYVDKTILNIFTNYFLKEESALESDKAERKTLQKNIKEKRCKKPEGSSITDKPDNSGSKSDSELEKTSQDDIKLKKITESIKERQANLKKYSFFKEKVNEYLKNYDDISNSSREKAYDYLLSKKQNLRSEESFLQSLINNCEISNNDRAKMRDRTFVQNLLMYLCRDKYKRYALPVIAELYSDGDIDIEDPTVERIIKSDPSLLCQYLINSVSNSIGSIKGTDLERFIEIAIKSEIEGINLKQTSYYSEFLRSITNTEIWEIILSKMNSISSDDKLTISICYLLQNLNNRSAKAFVSAFTNTPEINEKISLSNLVSELLNMNCSCGKESILAIIRLLEQDNRKEQRHLNIVERKLKCQGQELFSAIYAPEERLEELAINLKGTEGTISAKLVASQLVDIIISMREGFEVFSLLPLVSYDDWKYQRYVSFDSNIHSHIVGKIQAEEPVNLNTLGFTYQDDIGDWEKRHAFVAAKKGKAPNKSKKFSKCGRKDKKSLREPSTRRKRTK